MSNDSKIADAFADLKKALAETDGSTVVVDRKVLESLAQEISRQNSLTGLERVETEKLISLMATEAYNHEEITEEISAVLLERELTSDEICEIVLMGDNCPNVKDFMDMLHDLKLEKEWILDLIDQVEGWRGGLHFWGNKHHLIFAKEVLAQDPSKDELQTVLCNLTEGTFEDGYKYDEIVELKNKIQQLIKEKELFEKAEAEAEVLKKVRASLTEEEIQNLRRAFQRLDESNDEDSGESEH